MILQNATEGGVTQNTGSRTIRPAAWRVLSRSLPLLFLFTTLAAHGQQTIRGQIADLESRLILPGVEIENIHTGQTAVSDTAGDFLTTVSKGQLIEFRKTGYKSERMRVPEGILPPYFKIFLEKKPAELPPYLAYQRTGDWKTDSLHYYETYRHVLRVPQFSTLDAIQHPFSALSKRNRQIWAFQREYNWFEQEKFVDYTFNERIVANLTGLTGDSARAYMRTYRPTYELLRQMHEYEFFNYIRRSVTQFRSGYNPRRPVIRGGE